MILVAVKYVARDSVDGLSDADAAALELALRLDDDVTVATVGRDIAERALRAAVAAGARRAVRVDAPDGLRSHIVAGALAPIGDGATWVICGDASRDRGSGSVPAYLAADLGIGQALGLVAVDALDVRAQPERAGTLRLVRRLDGGRREVLVASSPAVLSVEGSVAHLRRASLPALLAAQEATVDVLPGPDGPVDLPRAVHPYRPRPRELPTPMGDAAERIRQLAETSASARRSETVVLEPAAAAAKIVETLRAWGYPPQHDGSQSDVTESS